MKTEKAYWDSGQLRYEYNYKDNGLIRHWWYSNGELESEINYKDGQLHGLFRSWYENGQLREVSFYQEDVKVNLDGFLVIRDKETTQRRQMMQGPEYEPLEVENERPQEVLADGDQHGVER